MSLQATKVLLKELKMKHTIDNLDHLLETAIKEELTCLEFMKRVLSGEVSFRQHRALETRMRQAQFPYHATLDNFDFNFQRSVPNGKFSNYLIFNGSKRRTTFFS